MWHLFGQLLPLSDADFGLVLAAPGSAAILPISRKVAHSASAPADVRPETGEDKEALFGQCVSRLRAHDHGEKKLPRYVTVEAYVEALSVEWVVRQFPDWPVVDGEAEFVLASTCSEAKSHVDCARLPVGRIFPLMLHVTSVSAAEQPPPPPEPQPVPVQCSER